MEKNIFTPDDFKASEKIEGFDFNANQGQRNAIFAAERANEILNKLIESWPVVYGSACRQEWHTAEQTTKGVIAVLSNFKESHYVARLAFIEKIKPKCEKHEPRGISMCDDGISSICKSCGVIIKAEWREK
jgi:hypothetical protein